MAMAVQEFRLTLRQDDDPPPPKIYSLRLSAEALEELRAPDSACSLVFDESKSDKGALDINGRRFQFSTAPESGLVEAWQENEGVLRQVGTVDTKLTVKLELNQGTRSAVKKNTQASEDRRNNHHTTLLNVEDLSMGQRRKVVTKKLASTRPTPSPVGSAVSSTRGRGVSASPVPPQTAVQGTVVRPVPAKRKANPVDVLNTAKKRRTARSSTRSTTAALLPRFDIRKCLAHVLLLRPQGVAQVKAALNQVGLDMAGVKNLNERVRLISDGRQSSYQLRSSIAAEEGLIEPDHWPLWSEEEREQAVRIVEAAKATAARKATSKPSPPSSQVPAPSEQAAPSSSSSLLSPDGAATGTIGTSPLVPTPSPGAAADSPGTGGTGVSSSSATSSTRANGRDDELMARLGKLDALLADTQAAFAMALADIEGGAEAAAKAAGGDRDAFKRPIGTRVTSFAEYVTWRAYFDSRYRLYARLDHVLSQHEDAARQLRELHDQACKDASGDAAEDVRRRVQQVYETRVKSGALAKLTKEYEALHSELMRVQNAVQAYSKRVARSVA